MLPRKTMMNKLYLLFILISVSNAQTVIAVKDVSTSNSLTQITLDGIQAQIDYHVSKSWYIYAILRLGSANSGEIQATICDSQKHPNIPECDVPVCQTFSSGCHTQNSSKLPVITLFKNVIDNYGLQLSGTLSHEVIELLYDAHNNKSFTLINQDYYANTGLLVLNELVDPVQDQFYNIYVPIGCTVNCTVVQVSNFVLPSWFDLNGLAPYDIMSYLRAPLTKSPGGFFASYNVSSDWSKYAY